MKKYLTFILLSSSLLLAELHTFWERKTKIENVNGVQVQMVKYGNEWKPIKQENWILKLYVPMPVQQNVKMTTDEAWYILIFGIMLVLLKRKDQDNRINRTTIKTFICFAIYDALFYFYNYKTKEYSMVYFLLLVTWIIIYIYDGRRNKATVEPGMDDKIKRPNRKFIWGIK